MKNMPTPKDSEKNKADSEKIKTNMSNLDIYIAARELNTIFKDGFIENIYEINDNLLQIKCRTKEGKRTIIIDASKRINVTSYDYPVPQYPSQYCSSLRKYMKGRRILDVYQYQLDRIVVFELANKDGKPWRFIIELFLGGNFLLIDDSDKIFMAKQYKIYKERRILAKQAYIYPEKPGKNFMELNLADITQICNTSDADVIRTISRNTGIVGYLAEEACIRANVDKNKKATELTEQEREKILSIFQEFTKIFNSKVASSRIYFDQDGNYISYEPFELNKYHNLQFKTYNTYNEAIDDFYAKVDSEMLRSTDISKANKSVNKFQHIYDSQHLQIQDSLKNRQNNLDLGNVIYSHMVEVDTLLNGILDARKMGLDWETISNKLQDAKKKGLKEALIFEQIYPNEAKVSVNIDDVSIKLDFRKSAIDNATELYKLAKRDKRRIEGAKEALEKTEKILGDAKAEKETSEQEKTALIKRPKKLWYEKFRWCISSDNFLMIGGKDASSNEVIVKKYLDKNDFYFHTETRGASSVALKNPDNLPIDQIPELTLKEVADFAACYSAAWKEGWGTTTIFWVHPDQVSKSPNPGEYLTKGSFFITGTKNFLQKPFMELAVGLVFENVGDMETGDEDDDSLPSKSEQESNENKELSEDKNALDKTTSESQSDDTKIYFPRIVVGPLSTVRKRTENYVRILPSRGSRLGGGKLAGYIKTILISQADESQQKWAKLLSNNDIMNMLPSGNSEVVKKKDK
jgi:predicted ribosome quality control (RQC) complex YloA/Tae2 family protein